MKRKLELQHTQESLWTRFALAMSWVALAILDFERHRLEGLVCWHHSQIDSPAAPHEP
jgi:hypothetical protein